MSLKVFFILIVILTLKGHTTNISSISTHYDHNNLFSGSYDTIVKMWDLRSKSSTATFKGH